MRHKRLHTRLRCALLSALSVLGIGVSGERDARACGGCIAPPPPPTPPADYVDSVITGERMIFSVSQKQSTLYDEITFSGAPSSFAWVLPIKGTATVGLSADVLFASLDSLTATQVVAPPENCPAAPASCGGGGGAGCGSSNSGQTFAAAPGVAGGVAAPSVTITAQVQVGPYETVQLQSTDPQALYNWLDEHGYSLAASEEPVVAAYVSEGFNFLAMKLVPGQGVNAMRPVRVTTPGAGVSLPLRMVSVGTGATTGVTLWVIGDGRWEPQNFPFFIIKDQDLTWTWATNSSNYETLRLADEAALHNGGWEIESSLELNQNTITSTVQYADSPYGGQGAAGSTDYLPVGDAGALDVDGGDDDASEADGSARADSGYQSASQVENEDLATLFAGMSGPNVRVTRMRSDLAHGALNNDLVIQASSDQSELSNVHNPATQVGEPLCPVYDSSCNVTGEAPRSVAASSASSPGGCSTTARRTPLAPQLVALGWITLLGLGAVRSRKRTR
jgi:hypothetical protein